MGAAAGDLADILRSIKSDAANYQQQLNQAQQTGALLGSLNNTEPERNAAGGAFIFGLFQAALSEDQRKQIISRYEAAVADHDKRWNASAKAISDRLIQLGIQ